MLLPKGHEKHKNLSTSFTKFDSLLQDLSENRFSGYIRLNFWEYEGVLVLDTGRMIEGYSTENEIFVTGEEAILIIFSRAGEPDGTIEVVELSSEVSTALGYALQSTQYSDENILSNYSLSQVFDFLEREAITGYVDIQFSNKKGFGTIYYLEGIPVEAVIMSNSGKMVSGEQVFDKFLAIGELIQPHVVVHRVDNPRTIVEDEAFIIPWHHKEYIEFWRELLHYLNQLINRHLKSKFSTNIRKVCAEVSDHYPFLDPEHGVVQFVDEQLQIQQVLHHPTFVQGMTIVMQKMLEKNPLRRFRKYDIDNLTSEITQLAEKHNFQSPKFDVSRFVSQIFRGVQ